MNIDLIKPIHLCINCNKNNTIMHATLIEKNIILSSGRVGFVGTKRSTKFAAQKVAETMGKELKENKIRSVFLFFKGVHKRRKAIIKILKLEQINILKLIDKTSIAHNGCRSPKIRRKKQRKKK
jgi:small subunit ribosomal protein S11